MLMQSASVRVFVATAPVDMRRGMDGLAALVREVLGHDPLSGCVFLFHGRRRRDRIKLLMWDGSGLWLHCKRLAKGRFYLPTGPGPTQQVHASELAALLDGFDLSATARPVRWIPPGESMPAA